MNQDAIDAYYQKEQEAKERQQELDTTTEVGDKVKGAVEFQTAKLIANDRTSVRKVDIQNSLATPQDISRVVDVLEKLLVELKPEPNDDSGVIKSLDNLGSKLDALPKVFPDAPEAPESVKVNNLQEFENYLKPLLESVKSLQLSPVFDPKIEVKPADVNVTTEKVDLEPLSKGLKTLQESLKALTNKEQPTTDLGPVIKATNATTKAINNLSFPVPNYVLPFIKDGKSTQLVLNSDGTLPTSSGATTPEQVLIDPLTTTNMTYIGISPSGTSESAPLWSIIRIDKTTGIKAIKNAAAGASTATWNDRVTETYS